MFKKRMMVIRDQESKKIGSIKEYFKKGKPMYSLNIDFSLDGKPPKKNEFCELAEPQVMKMYSQEYGSYFEPKKNDAKHLQYFRENTEDTTDYVVDSHQKPIGKIITYPSSLDSSMKQYALVCNFIKRPYGKSFMSTVSLEDAKSFFKRIYIKHLDYLRQRFYIEKGGNKHLNQDSDYIYSVHDYTSNKFELICAIKYKETKTGLIRYYVYDPYRKKTVSGYYSDIETAKNSALVYSQSQIDSLNLLKASRELEMINMAIKVEQQIIYGKNNDLEVP